MSSGKHDIRRYLMRLSGTVQGVGFRPYIYIKAKEYGICGWVNNAGANVVIDAEGDREALRLFILDIIKHPPLLAVIEKTGIQKKKCIGYKHFEIRHSSVESGRMKIVPPDMGVCDKCMSEVYDKNSRRYRYAFTNCTECGPRYSIIESLPYDRCNTAMKDFVMCDECEHEYHNAGSRRFHTEPNCCSTCGPGFTIIDRYGNEAEGSDFIQEAIELIKAGNIIAIKGVGGFHLCCDAKNELSVARLRLRKNRPDKPLAVMMKDTSAVRKYCELSVDEQAVLASQRRPIVLLGKNALKQLPGNIAPHQKRLGVMLPYLPVHHLLFEDSIEVLVMTSGNMSGASIQYKNSDAFLSLNQAADYFLLHDRSIHNPVDDSVVKVICNREMVSRRARGYIPYALNLGVKHDILALGAEQKSTVCISKNGYAYLSQYLGDLKDMDSYELYRQTINKLAYLIDAAPKVYACDLHPQYLSTRYAQEQQGTNVAVQHHHAHMVSCMAEHRLYKEVIGVIFDGTGMGSDGSIWGGEFLVGSRKSFKRVGCLKPVLLQGGDTLVKEPWKAAVSYLCSSGYDPKVYLKAVDKSNIEIVQQALAANLNCHWSSSMGRLFDCIAAIIGVRQDISYDAQAAVELESILDPAVYTSYEYLIQSNHGIFQINYESIISGAVSDIENNTLPSEISAKFHNTISNAAVDAVEQIGHRLGLSDIVLSGGVFENIYLLESIYKKLQDKGFNVYFNEQIPINDSGISVGQLAITGEVMKEW